MDCVANTIYYEARGEGEQGMKAVAHVIYNRAKKWSLHPCKVVNQPNQFATGKSRPHDAAWRKALAIAINPGVDITRGATYFHNYSVRPSWIRSMIVTYRFGGHIFYRKR